MYKLGNTYAVFGVIISISVIFWFIWYINRKIEAKSQQEWLTKFTAIALTSLLGLFIVDKIVSYQTPLLSDSMSEGLFDLISNIVLIIFGYQFNSATREKE
jgi:uncharacterized protein YacL